MRIIEVNQPWLNYLLLGQKLVEGRKASPKWLDLKIGEIVKFRDENVEGSFEIVRLTKYPSLEEYLLNEGVKNCLPGITDLKEGIKIYKQWSTDEELSEHGFLAIGVKHLD